MHKISKILCFALACMLVLALPAYAHDVPDLTKTGTVAVTMRCGTDLVPGGTLTAYRVGAVAEDDGNYTFVPAGKFAACGVTFDDLSAPALAADLAVYAAENSITGITQTIDAAGQATFADLELGLYLFVQHTPANGYNAVTPFLVALPSMQDGLYVYDVDAGPKVSLTRLPDPPPAPEPGPDPDDPGPKLPDTGMLNWPVPVLAATGLLLFATGLVLRKRARDEK